MAHLRQNVNVIRGQFRGFLFLLHEKEGKAPKREKRPRDIFRKKKGKKRGCAHSSKENTLAQAVFILYNRKGPDAAMGKGPIHMIYAQRT